MLGAWAAAVVVSLALAATALHGLTTTSYATGQTGSSRAAAEIAKAFPAENRQSITDDVIISSTRWSANSGPFDQLVRSLTKQITATRSATAIHSYLDGSNGLISATGHAALIQLSVPTDKAVKPIVALVQRNRGDKGFAVAITGERSVDNDFNTLSTSDLEHGELDLGLPAALVVLVLVFGSLIAGLIPIAMALLSILVGIGLVALLSLEFTLSTFVVNMLSGMGLALGIDYSLFVVSRYREERAFGLDKEEAIVHAGATASRAVAFSGTTFVVAMLGMLIVPTSVMRSLAAGAIVVGIVSVAAALTLLPALLSLLGDRVDSMRVPLLGRNLGRGGGGAESRFWGRVVAAVMRRPAISLVTSVTLMLALAAPLLGLHIGATGVQTLPNSMPSKVGYADLQREFPTKDPYPVQVVAQGGNAARVAADLRRVEAGLDAMGGFGAAAITTAPTVHISVLSAPVEGDPVGGRAVSEVRRLRATLIPEIFAGSGAEVNVGGKTAQNVDYFDAVTNPTALVLGLVLGMSFVVLLVAFRSLTIALVSIMLNLLSVGAAYGALTLVFIHGVGARLLGFQQAHVIEAWVPLFLFSVLFGLSMDYQVFLMSRIRERFDNTASTRGAVAGGVTSTARIITGAALIIVVVFTGFASGQLVMFQQMGFGIAVALALDATVIRSVVLPSVLTLLGDRSWYLPAWLNWLPDIGIEGTRRTATEPVVNIAVHAG
jgi:RND superfamily putative drug exporter